MAPCSLWQGRSWGGSLGLRLNLYLSAHHHKFFAASTHHCHFSTNHLAANTLHFCLTTVCQPEISSPPRPPSTERPLCSSLPFPSHSLRTGANGRTPKLTNNLMKYFLLFCFFWRFSDYLSHPQPPISLPAPPPISRPTPPPISLPTTPTPPPPT